MKTDNYEVEIGGELHHYCTKDMNITLPDNTTMLAPLWKQYCHIQNITDENGTWIGSEPKCEDLFRENNVTQKPAITGLNMKTFTGKFDNFLLNIAMRRRYSYSIM